jgi:UDP-glucose 4-epimerase
VNILITGSSGYIGSKLIKLLSSKHKIIKFDKKESIIQDLNNINILNSIFTKEKIDLVIHLAALSGVEKNHREYKKFFKTNVLGLLNLLEVMRRNSVRNILFASSCSVYGNNKKAKESDNLEPISFYGLTKTFGEEILKYYNRVFDFNYQGFRIFNVIGKGGKSDFNKIRLIPTLIKNINNNKPINLFLQSNKKDTCIRDYVHIDFVCKIFEKFIKFIISKLFLPKSYLISSDCIFIIKKKLEIKRQIRNLTLKYKLI